jgi:hypothetical protein
MELACEKNRFGFKPLIGVKEELVNGRDEFKSFRLFNELGVDHLQIKYLSKIMNHFKKSNINFIFYVSPKKRSALEELSTFRPYHEQIFSAIFKEIGEVEVIGSLDPSSCNLSEEMFYDSNHLNQSGAVSFSKCYFEDLGRYQSIRATKFTFDRYLGLKGTR